MSTLAAKYTNLKKLIGGNREKTHYEETFGMPMEEFYKITMPNPSIRRILAELEFSMKLSKELSDKYYKEICSAIDYLQKCMDTDGVLTKLACVEAENMLMPLKESAKEYELILAAHAHIDMNWMWGWQETVSATVATFQTMLKLMDEYDDFCFSQSQAAVYKIVEDYAPELKPIIEKRIKEGRWEVTASAWVETDKNMPSTASLLNHISYTRKYLHEHWGVDPKSLDFDFSPDTFGHSANVPEINSFGGVKYYYHCRGLDGDNALYRWISSSQKDILVYREQYWYNSGVTPLPAIGLVDVAKRSGGLKTGLMVYGVGDHGGGPTRRDIERGIEMQAWPIFPRIKFGTFHDYFKVAESVKENIPTVAHELNYFAPGCYTTQSRLKMGNRNSEAMLFDSQVENSLATLAIKYGYDEKQYESAWQNVLFTHFHDILTGSCVQESREHAMGLFAHSVAVAGTRHSLASQAIANAIDTSSIDITNAYNNQSEGAGAGYGGFSTVPSPERGSGNTRIFHLFNTSSQERKQCCEITVWDWTGNLRQVIVESADNAGEVEFELLDRNLQQYWDHKFFRILVKTSVPAFGHTTVVLKEKEPDDYKIYLQPEQRNSHPYEDIVLENEHIFAKFSFKSGDLLSFVDKVSGEEWLKPNSVGGLQLIDTENKSSNAWQIGRYIELHSKFPAINLSQFGGNLRKGFTVEQKIGTSNVKSTVSLYKGSESIQIDIEADWHEITRNGSTVPVLAYLLPIKDCDEYMYDVAGGVVRRGKMELDVPGLQYGAAISEGRAAYIITDCKYGYRANENGLISTLINSSSSPDPYPERGIHKIKLNIGVSVDCPKKMDELAFAANHKISYQSGYSHCGNLPMTASMLDIDCGTAVISQISTTENNVTCITLYETCGSDTEVVISLPNSKTTATVTDLDGNVIKKYIAPIKDTSTSGKITIKIGKNSIAMIRLS